MKKLLIISAIAAMFYSCNSGQSAIDNPVWSTDKENYIKDVIRMEAATFEQENHDAYVDPVFWNKMDYKQKQVFTEIASEYCNQKVQDQLFYVHIKDKMSGKQLAKYSKTFGYEVF